MKYNFLKIPMLALSLLFLATSCELDEIPNPNGPDLSPIITDATKSELQLLVSGIEDLTRNDIGFYYDVTAIIGREYYFFTGSDPRYTGEILGKGSSELDNAGFYGTRPFAGRYRTVKNSNILIEAVQNTSAALSEADKDGYYGFAKTMMAYELHLVLNLQYQNGIRLDVSDPDNLSAFVSYEASLSGVASLLDEAAAHLDKAGTAFTFALSSGFGGFDTPASFNTFNRAIAARIALYQGDKSGVRGALGSSFMDMAGDLDAGPARVFSLSGGDMVNPIFRPTNAADAIVAHPAFVTDMEASDDRASKIAMRTDAISLDDLTGTHDVVVFNSNEASIPFVRNEELILMMAEAQIGSDNAAAVNAIDIVRTAHGLAAYAGGTSDAELLDEVLDQRRYSLFGEGHRWVDMRRYDRLNDLPLDRAGDDVWVQMPRPVTE